jgi:pyrroline-5-carboxylate reductase
MIGIIGCGNMGQAIVKGLRREVKGSRLLCYDKDKANQSRVKKAYKIKSAKSLQEVLSHSKIILIAVKPQNINDVLGVLKQEYCGQLIISIAAGITTAFIEKKIGGKVRVIRVMPNLAAKVSASISAIAKGKFASNSDLVKTRNIFNSVGSCIILNEKDINAATAISGSGPGYIYYFLYCLQSAAEKLGFSENIAKLLTFHTVKGAVDLLSETDDFLQLINQVASKGGTTQAAIKLLEKKNFKKIIEEAVKQAKNRAKQLSM